VASGSEDPRSLSPNPRNYRRHPAAQQRALAGAIESVGLVAGVTVNRTTGHLVDGHLRVELALARGEPTVPVTYVELSPDEEALVLATLDPLSALAEADTAMLASLLAELTPSDARLRTMLGELAARNGIYPAGRTDPDVVPPVPDEAHVYVQPGDLWLLGAHRLLVADSTNVEQVARVFDGQVATLMATDPPYLIDYQGGNHPQSWHNRAAVRDKHWDDYTDPAASEAFFRAFLEAALPHLAPHVAIYQWHAHRRQALVEAAWRACGLLVHQQLIWVKARAVLTHSHFMWQHEPCFYGWVEGAPPRRKPPTNATTVWQVDQAGESDGIHPTQKPVELFARPIGYHTRPGEACYDPFLGSGTALIAAEQAGRRCFGLELSPAFAQVCIERWQAFTGQQAVRHG
jgi:DNA modification methylase